MEEIAQVYARSLFEAAKEQDKLDEIREQLGMFADAVAESHDLQVFFFSPYLSTQEKTDGLRRAIEGADEAFLNFLDLLVENHRMPVIFRIRREFDELWEDENQLLLVTCTGSSWFSSSHSSSNSRRMRKITGMRWFSTSRSRKLRKASSAPSIARRSPSVFSWVERYGEKKKTCRSWDSATASANMPSCSRISSSLSCSLAASNSDRA